MNIVIDPEVSGDELRQRLYAGNLVILTRQQALRDFVEYTRDELTELERPPRLPRWAFCHLSSLRPASGKARWSGGAGPRPQGRPKAVHGSGAAGRSAPT